MTLLLDGYVNCECPDTDRKSKLADIIDGSAPPVNNIQNSGAETMRKY